MEFLILGPLEVRQGECIVPLGGARQRAVLAVLLVAEGRVVSADRLIDAIWEEEPPPTAGKVLQNAVAGLRKAFAAFGEGARLETRDGGYRLRVAPQELDAAQFEQAVARARQMRESDHVVGELRQALALWRGAALADRDERFAREAAAPLDERRLVATEDLLDAELACGRHRDLVPDLESLVARYPFRERLSRQLMLALYRSGRQADALAVYRSTRRRLVEELGIEPTPELAGLERAMLQQDTALDLPVATPARPADPSLRRRRWLPVLAIAVTGVAAVGAFLIESGRGKPARTRPPGNSVASLDAAGVVRDAFRVGRHPTSVAVDEGAAWVLNADDQTISRIDLRTGAERSFGIGMTPLEIAAGDGGVWVLAAPAGTVPGTGTVIARLDPGSGSVTNTIRLEKTQGPVATSAGGASGGRSIAVGRRAVWVVNPDGSVSAIDPAAVAVVRTLPARNVNTVTAGGGSIWIVTLDRQIERLDERTGRVEQVIRVPAASLLSASFGAGSVWASDPVGRQVWRIDPGPERVVMRTIPVAGGVEDIVVAAGSVWVASGTAGIVAKINPESNAVVERIRLGHPPLALTSAGGRLFVSLGEDQGEASPTGGVPGCDPVRYGGPGQPRLLVVVDAPLEGPSQAKARTIADAATLVFANAGWHAGRYTVGLQLCDDATAQGGGFEYQKCAANAHAYVSTTRVVAVLGPYNSGCAQAALPVTAVAGLPLLSASATYAGLTGPSPSAPPGELQSFRPHGEAEFARLLAADDVQAAALAQHAAATGVRRVLLLVQTPSDYAVDIAAGFRKAAQQLGVTVIGSAPWGEEDVAVAAIAKRVRDERPDAVVLAGANSPGAPQLIGTLRTAGGPRLRILADDGFARGADVRAAAGPAADGIEASVAGIPTAALGSLGQQFIRQFRTHTRWTGADLYWAPVAAQAATVLLDALARSDGTRHGMRTALLRTALPNTVLGPARFDADGDITSAPVTILRLIPGGAGWSRLGPDFADGTTVVRVVTPRTDVLEAVRGVRP